jgi:amino acid transporter
VVRADFDQENMAETSQSNPKPALATDIDRWDLVALSVGLIIGGGIFGLPAKIFSLAGPASPLLYVTCAAAVVLIVFCFAEIASRFTEVGGPYLYTRTAFDV